MGKTCLQCLRAFVIIFNFIFVVIGLGMLGLALYLYLEPMARDIMRASGQLDMVEVALFILMGVGGLTLILGSFGCCGAYHESECLLGTYITLLLIVFVLEISAGVLGFLFRSESLRHIDKKMKNGVESYQGRYRNNATIFYMDTVQSLIGCCGARGPSDYQNHNSLPRSCCQSCKPETVQVTFVEAYKKGCTTAYRDFVKEKIIYILIAVMAVAAIELLGLLFSVILCCSLRRYDSYIGVDYMET